MKENTITKEIGEEIDSYLESKGYDYHRLFSFESGEYKMYQHHFFRSSKSKENKIKELYGHNDNLGNNINKYFLEYIGHILRKHGVEYVWLNSREFVSNDWTLDTINEKIEL